MSLSAIQGFLRCLTERLVKAIRQDLEGPRGASPYFSTTLVLQGWRPEPGHALAG